MHFIGLTVESYCSVLCQIANSPAQVYWCQNKANRTFLFLNPEQLANDRSGEYRKISYREIVLIGRALSEKLVFSEVHAKTVSETLRQMADRKKEKRNSTLCALYQEIFDRFANRQEFIYESTGVICKRVIETMEEISRKSSEVNPAESNKILQEQEAPSALSPSSPPSKKLPVQSNSEKPKEIHRKPLVVNIASGPKAPVIETDSQGTSLAERKLRYSQSCTIPSCTKPSSDLPRAQKMNPLKEYLENENCSAAIKTQLFNRLNNFEFAGEKRLKDASPEEQANYFRSLTPENIQHYLDYLRYLTGAFLIDLSKPNCGRFIIDSFKRMKIDDQNTLVNWLKTESTFDPDLLSKSLGALFWRQSGEGTMGASFFAMAQLLLIYQERFVNFTPEEKQVYSINHPEILPAVAYAISAPELNSNNHLTEFLRFFCNLKDFNGTTFEALIMPFMEKKSDLKIVNPRRDLLIEAYRQNKYDTSEYGDGLKQYLDSLLS